MEVIKLEYHDEVYARVLTDPGIFYELKDRFTFKVPGYRFNPKYKAGYWDGNICLLKKNGLIYNGLVQEIIELAEERDYHVEVDPKINEELDISEQEVLDFIETLKLPPNFTVRPYQLQYIMNSLRKQRVMNISPTSSGKSLMIYILMRWYLSKRQKVLLIVDTINLLNQMTSDFDEYGFTSDKFIHKIKGGIEKSTPKPVVISTWQSATKQPKKWFDNFSIIMVDEAHRGKATSVKKILEIATHQKVKLGFTGTLDGTLTNEMVLRGLFGPITQYITTKELIEQKYNSELFIKIIQLNYSEEERKLVKKMSYEQELQFLYGHAKRNNFIKKLALGLKGNTLITFQRLEAHGIPLFDLINSSANVPVYYVAGSVDGDEREEIRKIVNTHENSITVASVGTFSTGVNIPNLHNIITTSPTKAQIRTLQTIGRGLRRSATKDTVNFFDLVDNLQHKKRMNYTLKHFLERLRIYTSEEFDYKTYKVEIK